MTQQKLTDKQIDYLKDLGVDMVHLPKIYDKASLFDYINKLLSAITDALGTPRPTYQMVLDATESVIEDLDSLITQDD